MKFYTIMIFFIFNLASHAQDNDSVVLINENYSTKISDNGGSNSLYVVKRIKLENGGYTLWSDGFIEQWGQKKAGEGVVNFHIPFNNSDSISFMIQEYARVDIHGRHPLSFPTKTNVSLLRGDLQGTWMAEGY